MNKQIILRHSIHKSPRNDNRYFMSLVRNIKTSFVCADKGYDANKHHEFVERNLNAKSCIKIKENVLSTKYRSTLRRKILKNFDEKTYHQRSKVETIFSSIKRKYGSCLKARNFSTQKKEVICKLIAYNLDRIIKRFSIGFHQSSLIEFVD